MYIGHIQQILHAKSPIHVTGGRVQDSKMSEAHDTDTFSDKNICNQEIKTCTGRKWKLKVAMGRAIAAERNLELMGAVQSH